MAHSREPGSCSSYDCHGILIRTTSLNSALQSMVPNCLRPFLLYLAPYLKVAGQTSEYYTSDTIRCQLYWPHITNDPYKKVADGLECPLSLVSLSRKLRLKRFQASWFLELVAKIIFSPLPRTKTGKQFIFFIMDQYTKLAWTVPS